MLNLSRFHRNQPNSETSEEGNYPPPPALEGVRKISFSVVYFEMPAVSRIVGMNIVILLHCNYNHFHVIGLLQIAQRYL